MSNIIMMFVIINLQIIKWNISRSWLCLLCWASCRSEPWLCEQAKPVPWSTNNTPSSKSQDQRARRTSASTSNKRPNIKSENGPRWTQRFEMRKTQSSSVAMPRASWGRRANSPLWAASTINTTHRSPSFTSPVIQPWTMITCAKFSTDITPSIMAMEKTPRARKAPEFSLEATPGLRPAKSSKSGIMWALQKPRTIWIKTSRESGNATTWTTRERSRSPRPITLRNHFWAPSLSPILRNDRVDIWSSGSVKYLRSLQLNY